MVAHQRAAIATASSALDLPLPRTSELPPFSSPLCLPWWPLWLPSLESVNSLTEGVSRLSTLRFSKIHGAKGMKFYFLTVQKLISTA